METNIASVSEKCQTLLVLKPVTEYRVGRQISSGKAEIAGYVSFRIHLFIVILVK